MKNINIKDNYNLTMKACYIGYITQAIVNNFIPLLFLTFRKEFGISLDKIALLVSFNFGVQLLVDYLASKYGKEKHNGKPRGYGFSEENLKESLDEAAEALGMYIYGGDAVVRPDGSIVVVDFNDFPSFASCCRTAAEAIVTRVLNA